MDTDMEDRSPVDGGAGNLAPAAATLQTSDRGELIERIKRGESPTWVPNAALEAFLKSHNDDPRLPTPDPPQHATSPLLPSAELEEGRERLQRQDVNSKELLSPPSEIQRPRSALHAGDFREDIHRLEIQREDLESISPRRSDHTFTGPLGTSPTTPWYQPPPPPGQSPRSDQARFPAAGIPAVADREVSRSRAPSLNSFSSSYVLKVPTSPLVQQSNNADLDFSPTNLSTTPEKQNRRHTLPPHALQSLHSSPASHLPTMSQAARPPAAIRREGTFPYQTHQPRRSLTSGWSLQAASSPQTPAYLRSRRPSYSSEASPLHHASMVGSYEESILRGRMSTTPSKPFDFTAQIGVLGMGNCKPNLKCPAHVTVPFPAVFYSWGGGTSKGPSVVDDEPSPYVGHIDLEHALAPESSRENRRRRKPTPSVRGADACEGAGSGQEPDSTATRLTLRRQEKRKRRSDSPKTPPGGSYRIPQRGQLQIMIKNPNKTAVKLFLVPYGLEGMEPGTKTFIRQRCYSAGTIIDDALSSKTEPAAIGAVDPKGKPTLRYLIHLNICCTSRGRFYLYQHIRVVFANRVPDGKEKLQNETQQPEPRFSTYKPSKDPTASSSASARSAADKAYRRRSSGFTFGPGPVTFKVSDGLHGQPFASGTTYPFNNEGPTAPIPAIPFNLAQLRKESKDDTCSNGNDAMDTDSTDGEIDSQTPMSPLNERISSRFPPSLASPLSDMSSSYRSSSSHSSDGYNKLSRGDVGYGGIFGNRADSPEPGDGLLARRLRGLGVQLESPKNENSP
ncbi:MAG: hypothetical protein FRX48_07588 [Lasallia pustulata]|uniref:Atos-like conserved domain-containing protein n=1 Tax=Lasallia pustulata TaxID=136370 RepID=A0A5M8PI25_9LECA|nr:MAG: hypothetical protein FRX48_07588 [Lasallia pustulata]